MTTKTQSFLHTAHMNINNECKRDLMCAWSSSQVLVVMIAHYIVAQVSLVRVISWSSHDERISSTLSLPFPFTSSSSHSSLTSCISSCTSSSTLRAVATLRTSLERRWTLLTTPTSSQVMSPPLRPQGDLRRVLHRVPDPPTVLRARVPRGRGVR